MDSSGAESEKAKSDHEEKTNKNVDNACVLPHAGDFGNIILY